MKELDETISSYCVRVLRSHPDIKMTCIQIAKGIEFEYPFFFQGLLESSNSRKSNDYIKLLRSNIASKKDMIVSIDPTINYTCVDNKLYFIYSSNKTNKDKDKEVFSPFVKDGYLKQRSIDSLFKNTDYNIENDIAFEIYNCLNEHITKIHDNTSVIKTYDKLQSLKIHPDFVVKTQIKKEFEHKHNYFNYNLSAFCIIDLSLRASIVESIHSAFVAMKWTENQNIIIIEDDNFYDSKEKIINIADSLGINVYLVKFIYTKNNKITSTVLKCIQETHKNDSSLININDFMNLKKSSRLFNKIFK